MAVGKTYLFFTYGIYFNVMPYYIPLMDEIENQVCGLLQGSNNGANVLWI